MTILKWGSFALFAVAFANQEKWINIPQINGYEIWIILATTALAFWFSSNLRWVGLIISLAGFTILKGWLNIPNFNFDPYWLMLGGYLTMFFNSRW